MLDIIHSTTERKRTPMHVTPLVEPFLFSAVGDPTLANSNLPFREPLSFRQILEEELGTTTVGRKPCVKKFRKTRHPWICDAIHKSLGCHLVDAPNGKWGQAKENQSTLISLKQHLVNRELITAYVVKTRAHDKVEEKPPDPDMKINCIT